METLNFEYEAKQPLTRRAHVGVVGSGDLEVLIEPSEQADRPGPGADQRRRLCPGLEGGARPVLFPV